LQTIPVGSEVLKRNAKRLDRKGGKEMDRWLGPYTVKSVTQKGQYILSKGDRDFKQAVNRKNLKLYLAQ
jgi:hypothetical protein